MSTVTVVQMSPAATEMTGGEEEEEEESSRKGEEYPSSDKRYSGAIKLTTNHADGC